MRILLTGGGTGGHIFPLIAVARKLKKVSVEKGLEAPEIFYLGPDDFGREIFEKEGIPFLPIIAGKIRRYFSFQNILDIFKFPVSLSQTFWKMFWIMPDVIFSKGGYGSVPAVLVAWVYRVPIMIHESDSVPGVANRKAAKFAKLAGIAFARAAKFLPDKKVALVGNPVREELFGGSAEEAKKFFNLGAEKVLLVLGGSQGAQALNDLIIDAAPQLVQKYQIIHQCGKENFRQVEAEVKIMLRPELFPKYHPFPFLDENQMKAAYAAADLLISRAGAGSIFEIAGLGKPSILIPLPESAQDHQRENAYEFARAGACVVIEQQNLKPHLFLSQIGNILDNPEVYQKFSSAAKAFFVPNAAEKIAEALLELGR